MSTATTKAKKSVATTEPFKGSELNPKQRRGVVVSLALMILGGVALWGAIGTQRYTSEVKGIATSALALASAAEDGANVLANGGGAKLAYAIQQVPMVSRQLDATPSQGAHTFIGTLASDFGRFQQGFFNLRAALGAVGEKSAAADALTAALGAQYPAIDALSKRATSGRISGRGVESLARLAAYAESGVTLATVQRAEYDVRMVTFELQNSELRGDWAAIERTIGPAARAAIASPVSREEIAAIAAAAQQTRSQAQQTAMSAQNNAIGFVLGGVGIVLFATGFIVLLRAARDIAADFTRRFQRSVAQFNGGEEAIERVQAGLGEILEGKLQPRPAERGDGFSALQRQLNELIERIRHTNKELESCVGSASSTTESLDSIRIGLGKVDRMGQSLLAELTKFKGEIVRHEIDAAAASYAAGLAGERASESDNVMRDAMSRMESMREGLQEASKSVKRIGERGLEMGEAIDLFNQISEQIGVLSLNASLEAERAGEHGKGFRVVANEVRALSRRASEAVEKLSKLVQGSQADARTATLAVDRSTTQIVNGHHVGIVANALTASAATVLARIAAQTRAIRESGQRLQAATAAVQSHANSVKQVAFESLDQVESSIGLSETVSKSARSAASRFIKAA